MDNEQFAGHYQEHAQQGSKTPAKSNYQQIENESISAFCSHCGTKNQSNAKFCEECGNSLSVDTCPNCGKDLIPGADICESCGKYILPHCCSFCGKPIGVSDKFCNECGSSVEGIQCSICNHVSFSDFCSKCNHPLTERALEAQAAAKADPEYMEIEQLMAELEQIEKEATEKFSNLEAQIPTGDNEFESKIKQQLKEIQSFYKPSKSNAEEKINTSKQVDPVNRRLFSENETQNIINQAKETAKEIERRRKEVQDKMNKHCNREFPSPQIARNFYSARKPTKSNMVWHCYFADEVHPNPQNCGKPQMGGEWIIEYGEINWVPHDGTS